MPEAHAPGTGSPGYSLHSFAEAFNQPQDVLRSRLDAAGIVPCGALPDGSPLYSPDAIDKAVPLLLSKFRAPVPVGIADEIRALASTLFDRPAPRASAD